MKQEKDLLMFNCSDKFQRNIFMLIKCRYRNLITFFLHLLPFAFIKTVKTKKNN